MQRGCNLNVRLRLVALLAGLWFICPPMVRAGPPFVTDDPEPVEYRHSEVYLASQLARDAGGWSGSALQLEANYGILPDTMLHLIAPLALDAPKQEAPHVGYGDTELGIKYRFVQETDLVPQIGVFPLVELPTGNHQRGLGSGATQVLLPLWLQKSCGQANRQWTVDAGGGYWLTPAATRRDHALLGCLLQRQVADALTVGAEVEHETAAKDDAPADTVLRAGGIYDLSATYHLLFSAGHTVQGPRTLSLYAALQMTFGPGK